MVLDLDCKDQVPPPKLVIMAKPFLKWAGGKRQLIQEIEANLPPDLDNLESYIEPFVGGGALFFHMMKTQNFQKTHILDINPELILCYRILKSDASAVVNHLSGLVKDYPTDEDKRKEYYYEVRENWNKGVGRVSKLTKNKKARRVAEMIFLNKTCFNGLFRVNRKGEFNVPAGNYEKPSFPSSEDLYEVQEALSNTSIHLGSFEKCEKLADKNSFIYFDPPYRKITDSSFVSYSKEDFGEEEQISLASLYRRLDSKGAKLILSNSTRGDRFFVELFKGFTINYVKARRSINSVAEGRGPVDELLITNY